MHKNNVLGSVALAASFLFVSTSIASADAKFGQWQQQRLQVARSKTFEDGATVNDLLIVTVNTAYKKDGALWTSAAINVRERAIASPEMVLRDMQLADCTKDGSAYEGGEPATVYVYTYQTDANGYTAHGKMWISDATGLPLREEFSEPAPPANHRIAKAISATYRYNSDVEVPRGAELANERRLYNNQAVVRSQQAGVNGAGGPAQ